MEQNCNRCFQKVPHKTNVFNVLQFYLKFHSQNVFLLVYMSGTATRGDILEAFPYGNTVELVQISGLTLLNILEHAVSNYNMDEPSGRFLQYSGIHLSNQFVSIKANK